MKHLALRARSVRDPTKPFTTTGLGDRIHAATVAWAYSNAHATPVTIHLTKSKFIGGQFNNKRQSWAEIFDLFPAGNISYQYHEYEPVSERDWILYLKNVGIDAELSWYKDFPGPHESQEDLDISKYLKNIPLLNAQPVDISLPKKFVTCQWDSNDRKRTISIGDRQKVIEKYNNQGYDIVTVGGEAATDNLRWSLKDIAYAMSKAEQHIGVDSAFMHMAFLYFPLDKIDLYIDRDGFFSHHMKRAIANGVNINKYHWPIVLPQGITL